MTYQSINPFDGKRLRTLEENTDEALEKAVGTAATGDDPWQYKSFAERAVLGAKSKAFWRPFWMGDAMDGGPIRATYAVWNRYVF